MKLLKTNAKNKKKQYNLESAQAINLTFPPPRSSFPKSVHWLQHMSYRDLETVPITTVIIDWVKCRNSSHHSHQAKGRFTLVPELRRPSISTNEIIRMAKLWTLGLHTCAQTLKAAILHGSTFGLFWHQNDGLSNKVWVFHNGRSKLQSRVCRFLKNNIINNLWNRAQSWNEWNLGKWHGVWPLDLAFGASHHNRPNLQFILFNVLFWQKRLASCHSLATYFDGWSLDLGIVWSGP